VSELGSSMARHAFKGDDSWRLRSLNQYKLGRILPQLEYLLRVLVDLSMIDDYKSVISLGQISSRRRSAVSDFDSPSQWRTTKVLEQMVHLLLQLSSPGSEEFLINAMTASSHYHIIPYTLLNKVIGHLAQHGDAAHVQHILKACSINVCSPH
jgi:hypothetical protein